MAAFDPVQGVDWGTKLTGNSFTYYLYPAGQTVADPGIANVDDPSGQGTVYTSVAWNSYEIGQLQAALATFSAVANVTFTQTTSPSAATLRIMLSDFGAGSTSLGFFIPPGLGTSSGLGVFNIASATTWSSTAGGSLETGGDGFNTILRELGQALGLKHPNDTGGGASPVFPGVQNPQDLGTYNLNQSVNTVMSHVTGWPAGPNGVAASTQYGTARTPMAFDIAALQAKYGANMSYHTGVNTYNLPGNDGVTTGYACIWDAGGTNTISYLGSKDAVINLNAASLANTPDGGGAVSYVKGVHGGYTIAHGVTIQQAKGGSGNDLLVANNVGDLLAPGAGNNTVFGGGGADTVQSTSGNDEIFTGSGQDRVHLGSGHSTIISGAGADTVSASTGPSTVFGGNGAQARSVVFGSTGQLLFVGGSGTSTVVGGSGVVDAFSGGSSGAFYGGSSGNNLLCAGTGTVTLAGSNNGDELFSSATGGNVLAAGHGNETLIGSAAHGNDAMFVGNAGANDTVWLGAGLNTVYAGAGAATIAGGGNADLYVFSAGHASGSEVVFDFAPGSDHIALQGYGAGEADAAVASAQSGGGSTTFKLSDNSTVELVNVAALQRSFFV